MSWRKSWDRNWDEVRYCSKACRRRRVSSVDRALEAAIVDLLDQRGGTICPTEAIHLVSSDVDEPALTEQALTEQALTEPARRAARRLAAAGVVEIVQDGRVVDPSTAKGPIRVRRAAS
jgi:hypothetical protein